MYWTMQQVRAVKHMHINTAISREALLFDRISYLEWAAAHGASRLSSEVLGRLHLDVNEQDVVFTPSYADDTVNNIVYLSFWSPRDRTYLLIDGPGEGRIIHSFSSSPPLHIKIPIPQPAQFVPDISLEESIIKTDTVNYLLYGWDCKTRSWLYRLDVEED